MKRTPGSHSARYQALLTLLRTADTIWDASRSFFAFWSVSPTQFNVLNLLRDEPNGLSQTELSQKLIVHRSNVTGLIDRLEKRELVVRRSFAADRRAYRVILTETAKALLEEILPVYHQRANHVWD